MELGNVSLGIGKWIKILAHHLVKRSTLLSVQYRRMPEKGQDLATSFVGLKVPVLLMKSITRLIWQEEKK